MKKVFLFITILSICFIKPFYANASFLSLWANEDEEDDINAKKNNKKTVSSSVEVKQSVEEVKQPVSVPSSQSVVVKQQNNTITYSQPITQQNNIIYTQPRKNNVIVLEDLTNNYDSIDYDTIQAERRITESEIINSVDKWQQGIKNVYWENYRGNNVRVEMLRNNRDLKEMRLKFVQSQDMIADPDGSISDMLNKVAEQVMKRTCGKKAKQSIILYERPSVELVQETTYDNYKIIAKGSSLKEYGFRCIY